MKHLKRKFKRSKPIARIVYFLVITIYIISYAFFVKSIVSLTGIETLLRYILLILFALYIIMYAFINFFKLCVRKYKHFIITSVISAILIIIFIFSSSIIDLLLGKISSLTNSNNSKYTTYLVTLSNEKYDKNMVLGMVSDEDDYEGNVLAKKLIKKEKIKNEIKEFKSELDLLYALYDKEVGGIFISGSYISRYSNEVDFTNIATDTKKVFEISEKKKIKNNDYSSNKSLNEPFTALILGVDSETDELNDDAAFNGDTIILATFNPKTLSATLFSIPRDTYVPIACKGKAYNKINSSAAYGTKCVTDTIENLTGINIDYYVKINFKGVVDLVEALKGVTVDVEKPDFNFNQGVNCNGKVCEQNSDRLWGSHTVYIEPGVQTLNGEQALAYSRCRHLYAISDLARNKHQQDVIMAIAKKTLSIKSYSKFEKVLDAISKNISTNLSTNQMLSSYTILKKMVGNYANDENFINIQKTYLEVYNLDVTLPSGRISSALGYYDASLKDIINLMNINLEKVDFEPIKTFSYSINEVYDPYIAGKGLTTGVTNSTLQSFVGKTREEANSYCEKNDFNCRFTFVDSTSDYYNANVNTDLIASQIPKGGTLLRNVNSINFYINGASLDD